MFRLLRPKARSSTELSRLYYARNGVPFNGRVIVVGALRSLAEKARRNGEPWRVASTERQGPHPMKFWLELAT